MKIHEARHLSDEELFAAGEALHTAERSIIARLHAGNSWREISGQIAAVWADMELVRSEIFRRFAGGA